jgi:hypothetical protein
MTSYDDMIADLNARKTSVAAAEAYLETADVKDAIDNATNREFELHKLFWQKEATLVKEEYLEIDQIVSHIISMISSNSEVQDNRPVPIALSIPLAKPPLSVHAAWSVHMSLNTSQNENLIKQIIHSSL